MQGASGVVAAAAAAVVLMCCRHFLASSDTEISQHLMDSLTGANNHPLTF